MKDERILELRRPIAGLFDEDETEAIARVITEIAFEAGRDRRRNFGKEFSQADFVAGAMVAYFALGRQDLIPGGFILGTMHGADIFAPEPEDRPAYQGSDIPDRTICPPG